MTDKTDGFHRSNMVPNAGWMGAAAILSEMRAPNPVV